MRNLLSASAGVLAIAFTQLAFAQSPLPCGVKGIRTAQGVPKLGTAAFNPEYPARTNTFNWYYGQTNNNLSWNLNSVAINEASIWMPYWQTDNTQLSHIQGLPDLPTDGWELMKRDLGYDDARMPVTGCRNPYVIMYNKRSGMLRVFAAIGDLFNSYQFAEIKLRFSNNGTNIKAATLNRMEGIGTALLDTPPGLGQEFVSMGTFLNQKSKWFMADFPMEYDPCACQFSSKLKVEVKLISSANIQMTGVTTGTIVTTDIANPGATQTSSDFDALRQLGKKVGGAWSKGQQTYSSADKWASDVKSKLGIPGNTPVKIAAIDALKNAMKTSGFLKAGLNALPYVGLAVSTLDAFFGGGKDAGTQPVALQPMSVNMSTQTTGTISASALYSDISFNNPGTRTITTPLEYPYYNEAMGVFSLLTRPVVERIDSAFWDANGERVLRYRFKVPQQLQYAINPASGLEVQDFQVALVQNVGSNFPDILPANWEYEGMNAMPTGSPIHVFRTNYEPSGCLTNRIFTLDAKDWRYQTQGTEVIISPNSSLYLKFIINLRRPGSPATEQNTLIVLKYPVTTRLVTQFTGTAGQPCVMVQPQASATAVQTLCTGSVYQAAVTLPRSAGGTASTGNNSSAAALADVSDIAMYPNPAPDAATIRFAAGAEGSASAYVLDMLGKRVLSIMQHERVAAEVQEYSFPTTGLPAGLYRCVLETADGKRVNIPLSIVR